MHPFMQRQVAVRRTVFIRDIDQEVRLRFDARAGRAVTRARVAARQVTEEQVLHVFAGCGTIVDSRMCGDPNSALRFAFVEFDSEDAVSKARSDATVRARGVPGR